MAARRRRVNPQVAERKAARRAAERERSANVQPFVWGGVALVVLVGGMFLIRAVNQAKRPVKAVEKPQVEVVMSGKNARARDVEAFVTALQSGTTFTIAAQSDLLALGRQIGSAATDDDGIAADLLAAESVGPIKTFNLDSVGMKDADSATSDSGRVVAYFSAPGEDAAKVWANPRLTVEFAFRKMDSRYKVVGWEITEQPRKREVRRGRKIEKRIGDVEAVEVELDGEKKTITVSDAVSLPHMEGISDELKRKIDAAIVQLNNREQPTAANRAVDELVEYGKPSVPRLLNALAETKLEGDMQTLTEKVQFLRRVTQALELLTGNRYGFDVRMPRDAKEAETSEKRRELAIKQWFAYWRTYAYSDDWNKNIDSDEDLLKIK